MKQTTCWCLLLSAGLLTPGCGSRSLPNAGDGSVPSRSDSAMRSGDDARPPKPASEDARPPAPDSNDCIIAIRVDDCCTLPVPTLAQHLKNDPCLVAYPANDSVPPECLAKWRPECALMDCASGWPSSRVVAPFPGGGCVWADECQTDADCVLATNYAFQRCCYCPFAYPRQLLATNPCLQNEAACDGTNCPPPGCPPPFECGMMCPPCEPAPIACVKPEMPGDPSYNRCMPWNPW